MATLADVRTRARALLQDTNAALYRFSDVDLTIYVNEGLAAIYRLRPDFMTQLAAWAPPQVAAPTDVLPEPVNTWYVASLVDYVAGRAMMRDDQFMEDGKAAALISKMQAALLQSGL